MSANNEKAKADFIEACLKDHDSATCEKMWNDAKAGTKGDIAASADYAEQARVIESQKGEISRLKTQLRQAIDIAQRVNVEKKATSEAKKEALIISLMQDSKYTKEALAARDLRDLEIIRDAVDHSTEKTFANIAAEIDEQHMPKTPKLTVGEWDSDKKQWKGGQ